jgi:hypothetical protein
LILEVPDECVALKGVGPVIWVYLVPACQYRNIRQVLFNLSLYILSTAIEARKRALTIRWRYWQTTVGTYEKVLFKGHQCNFDVDFLFLHLM